MYYRLTPDIHRSGNPCTYGETMGLSLIKKGGKAGTARLSGDSGLVFHIGTFICYIPPQLMGQLVGRGVTEVLSGDGERIGRAWLSPLLYQEKQELTLHVGKSLYALSWQDAKRILTNARSEAPVFLHGTSGRSRDS